MMIDAVAMDTARRVDEVEKGLCEAAGECKKPGTVPGRGALLALWRVVEGQNAPPVFVSMSIRIAGPISTIQIEGKINNTIGIIILTGACCAFSCAR